MINVAIHYGWIDSCVPTLLQFYTHTHTHTHNFSWIQPMPVSPEIDPVIFGVREVKTQFMTQVS